MFLSILLILCGFFLLIEGANLLVEGSSNLAKKLHIPEIIIGLTIVSIGTSMPELFVSVTSALKGHSDLAIGNIIGSNVCNLLLILGLSTMIRSIKFQKETRWIEIPLCFFFTMLFFFFCNTENTITRREGLFLIFCFFLFISYTIYMGKKGQKLEQEDLKKEFASISTFKSILSILFGIFGLKLGGDLAVENAVFLAEYFHISEKIISLTILAIGTSLPELVTSVTAAVKGNSDIAIGNIIGSNLFNLLWIIGLSASIHPILYSTSYNIEMFILLLGTLLLALFPIFPPKNEMNRWNGAFYFLFYGIYLFLLFTL